ncbi:MAG: carboxymuconolactone decarboxylase family protein [Cyanobium sp.]
MLVDTSPDRLLAGPRSTLEGPFIPLLRSPALMTRLQQTGAYLRFESPLPARLRELVILWVARHWHQPVEWAIHYPLALAAGLPPTVLKAIREGRRAGEQAPEELAPDQRAPESLTPEEWLALDICEALSAQRGLDDATYARAVQLLGEAGLIDLVALVGYYGLLALVLNVARTATPPCPAPLSPPAGETSCGPAAAPCPPASPPTQTPGSDPPASRHPA